MVYTIDNFLVSMFMNFATEARSRGWNIFWHGSGETEAFTAGTDQGTISLIQDIPENPTFVTKGGDYTKQDQIVLPAFAISVSVPRKLQIRGLGHDDYEREVTVILAGLAENARQQAALADMIYDWLQIGHDDYYMPISDYSVDPSSPTALDPAEVWWADVQISERVDNTNTLRYHVNTELMLRYVE